MAFLEFLRPRRLMPPEQITVICGVLKPKLQAERQTFLLGTLHALGAEGLQTAGVDPKLEPGSPIDSLLKGLQIHTVVTTAPQYFDRGTSLSFNMALEEVFDAGDLDAVYEYLAGFNACGGDTDRVCWVFGEQLHRLFGLPPDRNEVLRGLARGGASLALMTQARTAAACGDQKKEAELIRFIQRNM